MNGALVALCLGNFAVGTATMVVPGMLPALADGLRVGIPDAGRLIAAFALTIAVFGPGLASAVKGAVTQQGKEWIERAKQGIQYAIAR